MELKDPNDETRTFMRLFWDNIDAIYKYLKDKDLIQFEANCTNLEILSPCFSTDSKGIKKYENKWSSKVPIEQRFKCIYVKNDKLWQDVIKKLSLRHESNIIDSFTTLKR